MGSTLGEKNLLLMEQILNLLLTEQFLNLLLMEQILSFKSCTPLEREANLTELFL